MEKEVRQIHIPAKVKERGEIVGYPIVYDKDSEDMGFVERIAPGAVTEALTRSDVRGLKNHDPSRRETRFVCLPCHPSPAAWASGFSMTGAVSTKTLISPPARSISQRPSRFSRFLTVS